MSRSTRTTRTVRTSRIARASRGPATLALGLTAVLAMSVGPSVAAQTAPTAPVARTAAAAPVVVNPGNQVDYQYDRASLPMTATGGTAPYTWSAANLPTGASINASTGLISGVLRGAGIRTVTVTARDAAGATASATFTWRVIRDACPRC
ncbi:MULTISPECIES: Ig domain-containing protein [unclassified Streptomyces]|uniref:Ig domain-containing protein n=1 Tax=unclassified Streptomyces TaxID=2593676 RepID=UPI0004BD4312|nr:MULTISPECIES: Ig domain-containing protein [unclassified Streptomyces]